MFYNGWKPGTTHCVRFWLVVLMSVNLWSYNCCIRLWIDIMDPRSVTVPIIYEFYSAHPLARQRITFMAPQSTLLSRSIRTQRYNQEPLSASALNTLHDQVQRSPSHFSMKCLCSAVKCYSPSTNVWNKSGAASNSSLACLSFSSVISSNSNLYTWSVDFSTSWRWKFLSKVMTTTEEENEQTVVLSDSGDQFVAWKCNHVRAYRNHALGWEKGSIQNMISRHWKHATSLMIYRRTYRICTAQILQLINTVPTCTLPREVRESLLLQIINFWKTSTVTRKRESITRWPWTDMLDWSKLYTCQLECNTKYPPTVQHQWMMDCWMALDAFSWNSITGVNIEKKLLFLVKFSDSSIGREQRQQYRMWYKVRRWQFVGSDIRCIEVLPILLQSN